MFIIRSERWIHSEKVYVKTLLVVISSLKKIVEMMKHQRDIIIILIPNGRNIFKDLTKDVLSLMRNFFFSDFSLSFT